MVKVLFASSPYQAQITIDETWFPTPTWQELESKLVKVATQNQLQGLTFHHWEVNRENISTENPATIHIPESIEEVTVMAVFK